MSRKFKARLGVLLVVVLFGTLTSVSFVMSRDWWNPDPPSPQKYVILMGGGRNEGDNFSAFYISLARLYHTFTQTLNIPSKNITFLYFDGKQPDTTNLLDKEFGKPPSRDQVVLNPFWLSASSRIEQSRKETEQALESMQVHPPIDGDTSKATILATLQKDLKEVPQGSQLWIVRVGHGSLLRDSAGLHSTMELLDDQAITDQEFGQLLGEPTKAATVIAFLNQCQASGFLKLPQTDPHLAVLVSDGAQGADLSYVIPAAGPEWTWTQALRQGLEPDASANSAHAADSNDNGKLSLSEIQRYILTHDYAAVTGARVRWDSDPVYSHPGFAYGQAIDPDQVTLP